MIHNRQAMSDCYPDRVGKASEMLALSSYLRS